jgi:hypothetical protein
MIIIFFYLLKTGGFLSPLRHWRGGEQFYRWFLSSFSFFILFYIFLLERK